MALDEVFLSLAARKEISPTLRLYSWSPPSLSLGYSQKAADVDVVALEKLGWDLVRRPTGGKAILHIDELTYSVAAPMDDPVVRGTLLESYQRISSVLQVALKELGVITAADNHYPDSADASKTNPICFEVPSNFEITANHKKLIGSAQARKAGGVLQHGSLPLFGDLSRITQVLKYATEENRQSARIKVLERATTLSDAAGKWMDLQTASLSFINSFSAQMNIEFEHSEPTPFELSMAKELVNQKYNNPSWTFRL